MRNASRATAWLLAAALATAAVVLWWRHGEPPPGEAAGGAPAAAAPAAPPATADAPAAPPPPRRDAAPAAAEALLRVQLVGLHRDAAWTTPLQLHWEGRDATSGEWLRHEAVAVPDAAGRAALAWPVWHAAVTTHPLLRGDDPHYAAFERTLAPRPDLAQELRIDVQVVAHLTGRVVTGRGEPVAAARVTAFASEGGQAIDRELARANTDADGRFDLQAPPGQDLWLLAAPTQPLRISGKQLATANGIPDDGTMRSDLLPAGRAARGSVGAAVPLPDLVLPDAVAMTGTVRYADGAPVAAATVASLPLGGVTLQLGAALAVQQTPHGYAAVTTTQTTSDGSFTLPATPGVEVHAAVQAIDGVVLWGEWPGGAATAPATLAITVPRPVLVRVRDGTAAVAGAAIEFARGSGDGPLHPADDRGELRVAATTPEFAVRARAGARQSPWAFAAAGQTEPIDLQLTEALGELHLEFRGEPRVRSATVLWTAADDSEGRRSLVRNDRAGPFVLHLPPGVYDLRVMAGPGEADGTWLLPSDHRVELGLVPQTLVVEARFGGRFVVHATDARGIYIGGQCRVFAADGREVTDHFVVRRGMDANLGSPGELMPGGPNEFASNLPPGDYVLQFDFPEHGAQRQPMAIRARATTDVRLRLP